MAKEKSPKKTFVLRVNADLMAAVERWAEDEFRSVNGQIEFLLSEALKKANRSPKQLKKPETEP